MKIFIVGDKKIFSDEKIEYMKRYGDISFSGKDNYVNEIINSDDKKIIVFDPDFGGWSFPKKILEESKNIEAVFLGTTDKSYIDIDYCESKGINVYNIPKYAADSVAEYLVMFMFNCAKKIPLQIKNNNSQDFTPQYEQMQLKDKKVGIVGFGNIGSKVANICSGIGMNVCYWDRRQKECNYSFSQLEDLFSSCDVIYLCLSINDETKAIITDDLLNKLKANCIFISCTGKTLFNYELIEDKVKNGKLFGYALEDANKPLDSYDGNVMVTSEYAWFTKEASESRINILFNNITDYLSK